MPKQTSSPPPGSEVVPRHESGYWLLVVIAAAMVLAGWLLPWYVEPTSSGIGFSPQDAVISAPTGVAGVLLYPLALALLLTLAGPLADLLSGLGLPLPAWHRHARLLAAVAGVVLTVVIVLLVGVAQEEPLFGPLTPHTVTDSAVWLTLYGYLVAVFVYWRTDFVAHHANQAFAIVALPFGVLLPFMFHQAPDFLLWASTSFAIYMLLALGLNVVVGFAGLLDLGYAAFFAIGAYTCASFASPIHHIHLPLWILIFIGAAVASLFGAVLGAPTLRLRGDYLAIVTLGFGEIIPDLASNNVGGLTGGPNGLSAIDQPVIGSVNFGANPQWFYWSLLLLSIVTVALLRNVQQSRVGRAWVALREDEVAAAAMGINTVSTKLLAFAMGASISGLAGAFYGSMITLVSPEDFGFSISVAVLSIIVLGGIGNIVGVILGSFVLTSVIFWALPHMNEWASTVSQTVNVPFLANINFTQYTYMVYGAALLLMMLLRPGGLLPSRARRVEIETGVESEALAAVQGKA